MEVLEFKLSTVAECRNCSGTKKGDEKSSNNAVSYKEFKLKAFKKTLQWILKWIQQLSRILHAWRVVSNIKYNNNCNTIPAHITQINVIMNE